jgi:heme O synthase-like polyprenyltransferase
VRVLVIDVGGTHVGAGAASADPWCHSTGVAMMSSSIVAEPIATSTWQGTCRRAADYLALTKPRVVLMVLITTFVGFYLGSPGHLH